MSLSRRTGGEQPSFANRTTALTDVFASRLRELYPVPFRGEARQGAQ
jgi:hypothetical protein